MAIQKNDPVGDEHYKTVVICQYMQVFKWSLHQNDIYQMVQHPFHANVQCWSIISGSPEQPKHQYDGRETHLFPSLHHLLLFLLPFSLLSLLSKLAAVARHWRTARSPCPSDTQMGSSQTATAATGSKWQSRNTWQPSLGKGIDRELETKDAGSHTCSTVRKPEEEKKRQRSD